MTIGSIGSLDTSSLVGNPERIGMPAANPLAAGSQASDSSGAQPVSFSKVLENAVQEVNSKMQAADVEKSKLLTGETGNVHQAMIAVQESNVAFSLMVEVRNKLVDSYQELMRMQV
jgi:flagellar hook-basal body complex protein FliE